MPTYSYKAKKDAQHTIKGQINASNQEEALEAISQLGLIPVAIEEGDVAEPRAIFNSKKVSVKELYLFSKQLARLLKAGVSLLRALEVLSAQTKSAALARILLEVSIGVKSGRAFSACLADYPEVFSQVFVSMARAGEEIGQLQGMLSSVAEYLRKQHEFSTKVRSALVYPSLMFLVGGGTVIFILTFVMPKMSVIFADSRQALPLPTVIVMALSRFFQHFGLLLLFMLAVLFMTFLRWRQSEQGAIAWGAFLLRVPFVKDLVVKADLARFTRTTSLLMESGLPLVKSIEVAIPLVHNPQLRAELLGCSLELVAGESFGNALKNTVHIPPMMGQLVSVGEEGGGLNDTLVDIAASYESDVDESTKVVTSLLEPVMILGVGAVVGLIVFAMLLPVFSMDIMAR